MKRTIISASAIALISGGALAQQGGDLGEWSYDDLTSGDHVRGWQLQNAEIYGENGEEIGSVESIFVEDNQIVAVTAEIGGFVDIGDRHVVVPFEQLSWAEDGFTVPLTEANVDDYDAWAEDSYVTAMLETVKVADDGEVAAGERAYRLSELIADYAIAADGERVGYVRDVLIDKSGAIEAVVFSGRYGRQATPWYGYRPAFGAYNLGYTVTDIENLRPFNFEGYDDDAWF